MMNVKNIKPLQVTIEIDVANVSPPYNLLKGQVEDLILNKYGDNCLIILLEKKYPLPDLKMNIKRILICGYGLDLLEALYKKSPRSNNFPIVILIYAISKEIRSKKLHSWNGLEFIGRGEVYK